MDIPFIISPLFQSFQSQTKEYNAFISDLSAFPKYEIVVTQSKDEYIGIIDVEIFLGDGYDMVNSSIYPNYKYQLCFFEIERNYGYCRCTPNMPGYRVDKHCCGYECDTSICGFSFYKVSHIVTDNWNRSQHDYWEFEDEFYLNDKELISIKKKANIEKQIGRLKDRIKDEKKRIIELEREKENI